MALAETTLSSAVTADQKFIKVASATSVAVGRIVRVSGEKMQVTKAYDGTSTTVPVRRGLGATAAVAHASGARVVHGAPSDFPTPGQGQVASLPTNGWGREFVEYAASGAITLPKPGNDLYVAIIGSSALAMTLADPSKDLDGCHVYILSDTKTAQHTITLSSGLGGAGSSYDVFTKNNNGGNACVCLVAWNEEWQLVQGVTGTLTNNAWALS